MTYFCKKSYAIGFAKHAVIYFKSYLSNMSFLVNLGYFLNLYPLPVVNTKVLYKSAYVNFFLYADDSCSDFKCENIGEYQ